MQARACTKREKEKKKKRGRGTATAKSGETNTAGTFGSHFVLFITPKGGKGKKQPNKLRRGEGKGGRDEADARFCANGSKPALPFWENTTATYSFQERPYYSHLEEKGGTEEEESP